MNPMEGIMKLLLAVLALLVLVKGEVQAFDVSTAYPGSGLGYTCTDEGTGRECTCSGEEDCKNLEASESCTERYYENELGHGGWEPDLTCTGRGVGKSCTCTWAREGAETDHRPDSYTPATENAPSEPIIRDHRRSRRNTTPTQNAPGGEGDGFIHEEEIVRARRGTPADESAPTSPEEEEEETPNRTVRDHRR